MQLKWEYSGMYELRKIWLKDLSDILTIICFLILTLLLYNSVKYRWSKDKKYIFKNNPAGLWQLIFLAEMFNIKKPTSLSEMLGVTLNTPATRPPAVCPPDTRWSKWCNHLASLKDLFPAGSGRQRNSKSRVLTFQSPLTQTRPSGWETRSCRDADGCRMASWIRTGEPQFVNL